MIVILESNSLGKEGAIDLAEAFKASKSLEIVELCKLIKDLITIT